MATLEFLRLFISVIALFVGVQGTTAGPGSNGLSRTPPMGWMSWQVFRCETNCTKAPHACINEQLYTEMADAMSANGYVKAGYSSVSIDDCWEANKRTATTNELQPDAKRFPSGMGALGDHMHSKNVRFGIYSDEGTHTCGGFLGSEGHEATDASTFAKWGVDYLKLDGCYNNDSGFVVGYPTMGAALQSTKRGIVYSCSWPAYLGGDEATKPYAAMIQAGCNSWRNWEDIQCGWSSLTQIIEHWGHWGKTLARYAGPGHWHDPDMLLIGNNCLSHEEVQTQMALWSISAAPLIMGNDLRNVSETSKAILLNADAIAIDQDPLGQMGYRLNSTDYSTQVWSRHLHGGDVAVALYNYASGSPHGVVLVKADAYCSNATAVGGGDGFGFTLTTCRDGVMKDQACASGQGYFYYNEGYNGQCKCAIDDCVRRGTDDGYSIYKLDADANAVGANITVMFEEVGLTLPPNSHVSIYDVWSQKTIVGDFTSTYTATNVTMHATAFLRLSVVA